METLAQVGQKTLLEIIAETNRPLARVLEYADPEKLQYTIETIFVEAYSHGEDEEACRIFGWYVQTVMQGASHMIESIAAGIAAFHLTYALTPGEGIWIGTHAMPRTKAAMADGLASAMMAADLEEGASQYFQVLFVNFEALGNRRHIIDALKAATGKDARKDRLLQFVGFSLLPEEMRRVFLNALIRNSEDKHLAMAFEIVNTLEGRDECAIRSVKHLADRVAAFDRDLENLVLTIAGSTDGRTGKIDVQYSHEGLSVNLLIDLHIWETEGETGFYQRVEKFHAATRDLIEIFRFGSHQHQYQSVKVKLGCCGYSLAHQTQYSQTFTIG